MDIEEYTVNLPITEEKITINAEALSSMAKAVEGIGEFKVNEGTNTFEIVVTAGNGEKKRYKINVVWTSMLSTIYGILDFNKY